MFVSDHLALQVLALVRFFFVVGLYDHVDVPSSPSHFSQMLG